MSVSVATTRRSVSGRIRAGSSARVSLSRGWGTEMAPDGYYVQISGVIENETGPRP